MTVEVTASKIVKKTLKIQSAVFTMNSLTLLTDAGSMTLLTEAGEVAESRSLKIRTDMMLVEVWARNSLYQFSPFIPHDRSLEYNGNFYNMFILEYGREISGTMSNKVPSQRSNDHRNQRVSGPNT